VLYGIAGPIALGHWSASGTRHRRRPLKQLQEAYEQQNADIILKTQTALNRTLRCGRHQESMAGYHIGPTHAIEMLISESFQRE